ncbi:hypothetical protein [Serratia fonticola]|uniref:COG4648 family protein n=1 Tax=Serratia fonticola TaxID=47917 RepID=UPI000BFD0478|nr:hypothetical protein [Serratia fonticola]ATM77768.1 DNA gyrase subunit B [Serratia fonticola]
MRGARSLKGIQLVALLALLAWPFLVWFGLTRNSLHWLLPIIALLLAFRLYQVKSQRGPMRYVLQAVALVGLTLCLMSYVLKTHQLLLFYPVVVNLVMLGVFGSSLWSSMPMVERLARLQDPELPPSGVRYTRKVTQIWCAFFILNGSMALFTVLLGDIQLWTLWNGMIAYLLMGALMAGEWLVRRRRILRDAA